MNKEEAVKFLQQIYPEGGHCWLDEQRIEAINMAIEALQEEPHCDENQFNELIKLQEGIFQIANAVHNSKERSATIEEIRNILIENSFDRMIIKGILSKKEKPSIPDIVEEHCWKMLSEEPVSEELEDAAYNWVMDNYGNPKISSFEFEQRCFRAGAKWQKGKDEYITDDLGEYISELSKQFPEVSFAKLSRIAVRVAKWKEQQFEKNRLKHCNSITNEQAELEQGFIDQHLDKYRRIPTFLDAIEYGMTLQKEQMMKDAVESKVTITSKGILLEDLRIEDFDYEDKVKLMVIKEE